MRRNATVRIAADERARIPFALVGVLLLITSTVYAGALADSGPISTDRSVERAMDRASADATPTIQHAATAAAYEAARDPVTESAETDAGEAIREESAFEDALRIRIYLAAEAALDATEASERGVSAVATIPTIDDPAALDEARDRVDVEAVDDGAAFVVTVRNVTTRATRDGHVVAKSTEDVTTTVAVPVLAAHERTDRFERRLNRDALDGPGLGRQLTGRLYPVAWARGYGQYRGAPIANVLANRHVELSTNAGIVRTQEAIFGDSDPSARSGVRRATARTGITDLIAPTSLDEERWTNAVLDDPVAAGEDTPTPDDGVEVGVNRTADVAFETMLRTAFDETLRSAYRVTATLDTSSTQVRDGVRPEPDAPGENWTQVDERVTSEYTVVDDDRSTGEIGFGTETRTIVATRTVVRQWQRRADRRTTRSTWTDRYRVVVDVDGEYAPTAGAPDRPIHPIFESGGALEGPNLADSPTAARRSLDAEAVDDLAVRTVADGEVTDRTVVYGARPDRLRPWVYDDVAGLREAVRNLSVTVEGGAVASGSANPPAKLASELRERRTELVDPPDRYDGASDRARVAARAAYVDAVIAELDRRASATADRNDAFTDSLPDAAPDSANRLQGLIDAGSDVSTASAEPVGTGAVTKPIHLTPRTSPGYLPRTAVTGEDVTALDTGDRTHLLATRNVNYATVPYGTASEGIVDAVLGGDAVPLRPAASTLAAVDRTLAETDGERPVLRTERDRLAADVAAALDAVDRTVNVELRRETDLTGSQRRELIRAANERWDGPADRGTAVGTGAYADAIAAEADGRTDLSDQERDRLEVRLRVATREAVESDAARVPESAISDAAEVTRTIARSELESAVEDGLRDGGKRAADRWMHESMRGAGAGLPVAPVPGYWYATVNVWTIEVRGVYPRFVVRSDGVGSPGSEFAYVRESGNVTVEVGGEEVILGSAEPIEFETGTTIVVAVPPGPPGVGDVDGVRDERSSGWSCRAEEDDTNDPDRELCG